MPFFEFRQNNSGGSFLEDIRSGISKTVIVEADNEDEATYLAERIGLYFDGCDTGRDCSCCGDRWNAPWQEGTEVPCVYREPINEVKFTSYHTLWHDANNLFVHYKDGRVERYAETTTGYEKVTEE